MSDNALYVVLYLTEDSSQAKITSVCVQNVVSVGKDRIGARIRASRNPANAVKQVGCQTNGTSFPVNETRGYAMSAKLEINRL